MLISAGSKMTVPDAFGAIVNFTDACLKMLMVNEQS